MPLRRLTGASHTCCAWCASSHRAISTICSSPAGLWTGSQKWRCTKNISAGCLRSCANTSSMRT
ncbi:hypothetical protein PF004_g32475 [Phytophthora fragariae]|uniref:Uncharacterized protein n=1 Tax=Phytophthora fragariae TaxID=53985 RepID=A0A6G0M6S6_9STRA|nr:hypothetical protein PF004_g32475 [Phytophthora fragariae]